MEKRILIFIFIIVALIAVACNAYAQTVFEKKGNIYFRDATGKETKLTSKGKDYEPKLFLDGKRIIFIREIKPCPGTEDTGWMPSDCTEIWGMNVDGSDERYIIKSNYSKDGQDMNYYLGSFGSLNISPDGKYIYFLAQNCAVDAILYRANFDGSDIKRLSNAHQIDMIGGNIQDEYYGYLVAGVRKLTEDGPIKWSVVLMDINGREIQEIENFDEFWTQHRKM